MPARHILFCGALFLKRELDAHRADARARVLYTVGQIVLDAVSVKADREPQTRLAHDRLLLFVRKKAFDVGVLLKMVNAVIIDVQLPEDALLCHALAIAERILAALFDVREQIGVRHPCGATAALGKGEKIPTRDRGGIVYAFDQAVIEKGDVSRGGQRHVGQILVRGDLDPPQNADLIRIFFADQVDVIKIAPQGASVILAPLGKEAFEHVKEIGQCNATQRWYWEDHNQDELYSEDLY